MIKQITAVLVGTFVFLRQGDRDERGLTQSTENAILLAGAVAVALAVITAITAYVKSHLPG
jgi:branched-subunit amino acid transport protein